MAWNNKLHIFACPPPLFCCVDAVLFLHYLALQFLHYSKLLLYIYIFVAAFTPHIFEPHIYMTKNIFSGGPGVGMAVPKIRQTMTVYM